MPKSTHQVKWVLALLFFLSGVCALVYEIVWVKMLGLVFGNTTFAISTVLAVFMGGLGAGSYVFGRKIDRGGNPLALYAILEITIGVFCLCTPLIWKMLQLVYIRLYQMMDPSFVEFTLIRLVLASALLFIPTFCMGATLPVLVKYITAARRDAPRHIGFLYGINTLGACCGVVISGFWAIAVLGLNATVFVTAAVNCAIGIAVLILMRRDVLPAAAVSASQLIDKEQVSDVNDIVLPPAGSIPQKYLVPVLLISFALSGAASMIYELCWSRTLGIALGSSVYSFAIMLATFLAGIGIGGMLIGRFAKKISINYFVFAGIELAVAASALVGIYLADDMPYYFLRLYNAAKDAPLIFTAGKFLLCSVIMLLPTVFIGMTFPVAASLVHRARKGLGNSVGITYGANTIGSIIGSLCGGFVLIPLIGIQGAFKVAITINLAIAGLCFLAAQKDFFVKKMLVPGLGAGICVFALLNVQPWSKSILTTNIAINPQRYVDLSREQLMTMIQEKEIIYYREGLDAVVAVKRTEGKHLFLTINGNIDASSGDMYTQLVSAYLPLLFCDNPQKALVIGMGSGVTLSPLANFGVSEIHCVELEEAVVEAAREFSRENRSVLDDERVTVFVNDGRNHLLVYPESYDVIISEPSSPWMAGVATLFTKEQFELMKKRLAPGGVVCQWFNIYSMSPDDIRMVVNTYCSVFSHVQLWHTNTQDLLLVGSERPLVYDVAKVNRLIMNNELFREDLQQFAIRDAAGLLCCFLLDSDELAALSKGAVFNTDNFPRLEYSSPKYLYHYRETIIANRRLIEKYRKKRYPPMINMPQDAVSRVVLHNAIARGYLEKNFFSDAVFEIGVSHTLIPKNPGAVFNMGLLQLKHGETAEAVKNLSEYCAYFKDSAEAHFLLASACVKEELFEQANEAYSRAVQLAPKNVHYHHEYAVFLMTHKMFDKAVGHLERAVALGGMDLIVAVQLSVAYLFDEQYQQAVALLETLTRLYPHNTVPYTRLGGIYMLLEEFDRADDVYKKACTMFPYEASFYAARADIAKRQGKPARHRTLLKKARALGYMEK